MKAQMVKNAVIVPVGAKGGFVVKRPPRGGDRAALQAEVVACYQTFMRGMLDLTDNRVGDRIVMPRSASSATTTTIPIWSSPPTRARPPSPTSPTRSARSTASGWATPSRPAARPGYDHKGMGITARGAWESVKRHFLELGLDCQTEPFTVIGDRRHVGRRVRQRHAAVRADQTDRRLRPPAHLHRSGPRSGPQPRRAQAPVRAAAVELGRLRPRPAEPGRRRLPAQRQVDQAVARRRAAPSRSRPRSSPRRS